MANQLVTILVSQLIAAAAANLQQSGALISQGATSIGANKTALLTQPGDVTSLMAAPLAIAGIAWNAGVVTVTTAANIPGLQDGDTFGTSIAGALPAGYDGTVTATVTGPETFTFPLANNPGAETALGTYTPPGQVELQAMVNSFFGQGGSTSVKVLELGPADGTTGPPLLSAYITANPKSLYSYLVPRNWDATGPYLALLALYESPTGQTYFFTTTTLGNYATYPVQAKDAPLLIEAPGIALTEFSMGAAFNAALSYNPGPNQLMTSFNNKFLFGVTPYPTQGNAALLATLAAANVSVVGTGAEGGISTATISGGKTLDGHDFSYWFEVDWVVIQSHLALANYVLNNGANNPVNPLGFNQDGIDRLQDVEVALMQSACAFGIAQGNVTQAALTPTQLGQALDNDVYEDQNVVNAVPFLPYNELNPNDYSLGKYAGLTVVMIPQAFFQQIVVQLLVTNLIAL
jgi:hypothetical protein